MALIFLIFDIWTYMTVYWIYEGIWRYMEVYVDMEVYGGVWEFMWVYESIWRYMEVYGCIRRYVGVWEACGLGRVTGCGR